MAGVGVGEGLGLFVVEREVERRVLFGRSVGVQLLVQARNHHRSGRQARHIAVGIRLTGGELHAHGGLDGGHQESRRNAFAGYVADGESHGGIEAHEIVVVAGDDAGGIADSG